MTTDLDGNGLVDGSELTAYQLFNGGNPITLSDKRGRTFSDSTSGRWDIIAGAESGDSFVVLIAKETRRRGTLYQVRTADSAGILGEVSMNWADGQTLADTGYEDIFNVDLNEDGIIGNQPPVEPDPINDGTANFAIDGTPALGQVLSIRRTANDPDGDGTPTIAWLASNQDGSWETLSSDTQITISSDLEGRQLRANVSYTDGEGFSESVTTESVLIPVQEYDDYGSSPGQSGSLNVGTSLQGEL